MAGFPGDLSNPASPFCLDFRQYSEFGVSAEISLTCHVPIRCQQKLSWEDDLSSLPSQAITNFLPMGLLDLWPLEDMLKVLRSMYFCCEDRRLRRET